MSCSPWSRNVVSVSVSPSQVGSDQLPTVVAAMGGRFIVRASSGRRGYWLPRGKLGSLPAVAIARARSALVISVPQEPQSRPDRRCGRTRGAPAVQPGPLVARTAPRAVHRGGFLFRLRTE